MTNKHEARKRIRADVVFLIAILLVIGAAALFTISRVNPMQQQLDLELAKTALTVLSVTVFGTVATLAVWRYQKRREAESDQLADERRDDAEQRIRAEENLRRDAERRRDARARDDALLRSLLQDTLRSYNRVKRIRRLLRAYTKSGDGDRFLQRNVYDVNIQHLIDEQLNFEELARLTALQGYDRIGLPTLAAYYKQVESYLNGIISEYEENRYLVAEGQTLDASTFPHLWGFMKSNWKPNGCQLGFRIVSGQMDRVIAQIRASLMERLDLPNVTNPKQ